MPEFFQVAYAARTLQQLLYLRRELQWRSSRVDCMLAALVLGSLHGESERSPSYLSNQMPRTISTKPSYSVRFWREHGHHAPEREVFGFLRNRVDFRYESIPPDLRAKAFECDFRDLPDHLIQAKPKLVVTSPPYLDTTNFEEDQCLRLWFLGRPPKPTYCELSRDDRHENPESYWRLVGDMWRMLGRVLARRSHVVIRMGGKKLSPEGIIAGLTANSCFSGRKVELIHSEVSPLRKRQTHAFRPGRPRWRLRSGLLLFCCLLAYGTALSS